MPNEAYASVIFLFLITYTLYVSIAFGGITLSLRINFNIELFIPKLHT